MEFVTKMDIEPEFIGFNFDLKMKNSDYESPFKIIEYKPKTPYDKISTFNQIIHKQNADSDELYNFTLEHNAKNNFEFYRLIFKHEIKNTTNETNEYKQNDLVLKHLIYQMASMASMTHIDKKFHYLKTHILFNIFNNENILNSLFETFSNAQKIYRILNRFAFICKWKKAPYKIQTDLCMEEIDKKQRNVITILHHNHKYLFTISDILNILNNSLTNSCYFFTEPLPIKNPYTNLPFQKSDLYNMYFFIKERVSIIPPLFQAYFISNFDLKEFRDNNQPLIQRYIIDNHVKNGGCMTLYNSILKMLKNTNYTNYTNGIIKNKLIIDKDFPKEKLVEIMKPYLKLYFTSTITNDMSLRNNAKSELRNRLNAFYNYNKMFGRKMYSIDNKNNKIFKYNDKHIEFKKTSRLLNFDVSHLRINEINQDYNAVTEINITNSIERLNNINRLFYNYNETNEFQYVNYNDANQNAVDEDSDSDTDTDIDSDSDNGSEINDDNDTIIILDNGTTSEIINNENNNEADNEHDNDIIEQQHSRRRTMNRILLNTPNIDPVRMPNTSNFIYNSIRNHLFESTPGIEDTDRDIYWFIDRNGDSSLNE
jgi:hypothetical protein